MSSKLVLAAAAMALGALLASWWCMPGDPGPGAADPASTRAEPPALVATSPHFVADASTAAREAVPLRNGDPANASATTPDDDAADTAVVTGLVVDERGAPVANAAVLLMPWLGTVPSRQGTLLVMTHGNGRFVVAASIDGEVLLVAAAKRGPTIAAQGEGGARLELSTPFATGGRLLTVRRDDDQDVGTIRLAADATISGRVSEGGQPVAGAPITWVPKPEWRQRVGDFEVQGLAGGGFHVKKSGHTSGQVTAADGTFRFAVAPGASGSLRLLSRSGAEAPAPAQQVTAPAEVAFALAAPACLKVLIDGQPAARVFVKITGVDWPLRTDEAGEVRVRRATATPMRASIELPGEPAHEFDVPTTSSPEQPTVVALTRRPRQSVVLTVTSARPVRALRAALTPDPVDGELQLGIPLQPSPGSSTTLFATAAPGSYRLSVGGGNDGDDAFVMPQIRNVEVGGHTVHVEVAIQHGGHLVCTVRDRADAIVAGHCKLIAADARELEPMFGRGGAGRLQRSQPSRTTRPIPAGRYEAVFDVRGHGIHRRFVDIAVAETTEVTIRLP
jgi:hypothetical protein